MRRRPSRRRLLLVLVAATLAVVVADVAEWPAATHVRGAGAAVLGPLERLAGRGGSGALGVDDAAAGRERMGFEAAELGRGLEEARQLRELLDSPGASGARFVPARVVAVGAHGASGPERVTIDIGSRDGISPDLTVVNAQGLVGRVVSAGPWTADVLLVGSADLAVGVRVGSAGTLGSLTGATGPAGAQPRPAGRLGLELVERGTLQVGDAVRTMGSVGGRPFVAGIPVGRVTEVDPAGGRFAATGAVTPSVDVTSLDIVGVLLTAPRTSPRAPVQGGSG